MPELSEELKAQLRAHTPAEIREFMREFEESAFKKATLKEDLYDCSLPHNFKFMTLSEMDAQIKQGLTRVLRKGHVFTCYLGPAGQEQWWPDGTGYYLLDDEWASIHLENFEDIRKIDGR